MYLLKHPDAPTDSVRRRVARALALAPLALATVPLLGATGCDGAGDPAEPDPLDLTLACVDDDDADATPAMTEGPYFTANSPARTSLLQAGLSGTVLVITGKVLNTRCEPVANALVDFWQADAGGDYDNTGYTLRGHQFTGADGTYRLETVVPGLYPGRTRHLHVKAQAPGKGVLTTQLFFPGDAALNERDGIYDASLLMDVAASGSGQRGAFNFVVPT